MVSHRIVFNHVGLCVADTARSRRFYEGLLGFEFWWQLEPPDEGTSQLLQLNKPVGFRATYLVRDGLVLELLAYSQRALRAGSSRVMDQLGSRIFRCPFPMWPTLWRRWTAAGARWSSAPWRLRYSPVHSAPTAATHRTPHATAAGDPAAVSARPSTMRSPRLGPVRRSECSR